MAWRVISRITDSVKCPTLSLRKCLPRVAGRSDELFGASGPDARWTFDHALGDFCRLDVLEALSAMAGRLAQSRGQKSAELGPGPRPFQLPGLAPAPQSLAIPLHPRSTRFGREISPTSDTSAGRGLWPSPPLPRDFSAARWFRENREDASIP